MFLGRRGGRRTALGDREAHSVYAARTPARSVPWPVNDAGPSWGPFRPRHDGVGHRHIRALLRVHLEMRRCGVEAAGATLSAHQIALGVLACHYFGLDGLAELMTRIPAVAAAPHLAIAFDAEYRAYMGTADELAEAIMRKVAASPEDFPLEPI